MHKPQPNPELHSSGGIQNILTKAERIELKPQSQAQVSGLIPEKMCGENPKQVKGLEN